MPERSVRLDPRVEHSRQVIAEAAVAEFAEHGFDGMTIEGVATRAGVGKSTIYRHWRTKLDLVDSAMRLLPLPQPLADDAGRPVIDRVTQFLVDLEELVNESMWGELLPALVQAAELFEDVADIQRRFGRERRAVLAGILGEAVERDELPRWLDVDILASSLVGFVFLARLMQHERIAPDVIARMVAQQLAVTPLSP